MPTHPFDFEIQADIFSTTEIKGVFNERRRFSRWLEFEAALAQTLAELEIIPQDAADEISTKANIDHIDLDAVKENYKGSRNSLIPLIKGLRSACSDNHGEFVHYGATTQDVLDTSQIMELRDTFRIIYRDLRGLEATVADLTLSHINTPMIGRTHGQQALPITFGLKCGVWLAETRRHIERVKNLFPRLLTGQLSGAVGTMAALGDKGREVSRLTLEKLGLNYSPVAWHASRDNIAEAAGLMAIIAATLEKIANEIIELGKIEINELREPAPEGAASSSTMPHKRNPVICQRITVLSRQIRALAPTVTEAMTHEHERDGRAIWSEWLAMPQISVYTATALHYTGKVMRGLDINPDNMLKNLLQHGDMVLSEWLLFRLGSSIGKMKAQEIMHQITSEAISSGRTLRDCALADMEISPLLSGEDLKFLEHPEKYIGESENIIKDLLQDIAQKRANDPDEL